MSEERGTGKGGRERESEKGGERIPNTQIKEP